MTQSTKSAEPRSTAGLTGPGQDGNRRNPADLTVLIADDDRDCREVASRLLRNAGHKTKAVASAREALAAAGNPEIGLVVTDMWMPDGNGMQLVEKLAETRPDLEVIVFSGHATAATREKALAAGCFEVVDKPGNNALLGAVGRALGRSREERLAAEGRIPRKPELGRVLLVDDHPGFAKLVGKLLESRGYRITVACDGAEALEKFAGGEFDLVLMDVNMPRMGGVEATREIHRRDPAVSILLISGESSSGQVFAAMSAGANSMLPKPVNLARLERQVGEYVAVTRRRRRLARRETHRRQRSIPKKALCWLHSPRTSRSRRKVVAAATAILLSLVVGLGAATAGDWIFNAGRFTLGLVERMEGRLDRLEGYLERDEQREVEQRQRHGPRART